MSIGQRLQKFRRMTELPASTMGVISGLSRDTVRSIESGDRPNPSSATLSALAKTCGVPVAAFFDDRVQVDPEHVRRAAAKAMRRAAAANGSRRGDR